VYFCQCPCVFGCLIVLVFFFSVLFLLPGTKIPNETLDFYVLATVFYLEEGGVKILYSKEGRSRFVRDLLEFDGPRCVWKGVCKELAEHRKLTPVDMVKGESGEELREYFKTRAKAAEVIAASNGGRSSALVLRLKLEREERMDVRKEARAERKAAKAIAKTKFRGYHRSTRAKRSQLAPNSRATLLKYVSVELGINITTLNEKAKDINRLCRIAHAVPSLRRSITNEAAEWASFGAPKTFDELFFGDGVEEGIVDTFVRLATAPTKSHVPEAEIVAALIRSGVLKEA
jgi:hypothetical protein